MSEPELVTLTPTATVVVRTTVPTADLQAAFDRGFGTVMTALQAQSVVPGGPAFGLYHGGVTDTVDLELGFPTASPFRTDGEVHASELPGGRAVRAVHVGGYDGLAAAWPQLRDWILAQGLTPGADMWESYDVEPRPDMDPADLRTTLVWPVS